MGILNAVRAGLEEGTKRIKAYHGSPHDFDKFSTENIGTGEGAQAYGHGLYFAEREGTAKTYRDALSGKNASFDDGSYVPDWVLQAQKDGKLDTAKKDFQDRIVQIKDAMDSSPQPHLLQDQLDSNAKILQGIDRLNSGDVPKVGRMYEVDIDASPDELLDFDAPLSEQSKSVLNAIEANPEVRNRLFSAADSFGKDKIMGRDILEMFAQSKSGGFVSDQVDASQMLKKAGIKGIKYADAQTRFSPKGRTNNYVIFDDKTVEIARKYGVSMPVAGAILAGTMTPEDAQAGVVSEGVHLAQRVLQLGILKAQSAGNPTAVKTAITKYNKAMKESPAFADRERRAYAEDYKTIFNEADIAPKQIITPESLVGNTITPVRGDRSNIGQLSQVGGIPVDVSVEGGVKFSRQHGGWASSEGVARGQHNKRQQMTQRTTFMVFSTRWALIL